MKKVLSLVLVLLLTLLLPSAALADTNISGPGEEGKVNVIGDFGEGFIVTIPDSVTFKTATDTPVLEVTASDVVLEGSNRALHITVKSENGWEIRPSSGEKALKYEAKIDVDVLTNGSEIITVPAGQTFGIAQITFTLLETPAKADRYTDTLTFTVTVS